MSIPAAKLSHFANPAARSSAPYPSAFEHITSLAKAHEARAFISRWPGYAPTPLHSLDAIARQAGLGGIFYKDESKRFQLKSFKALGGAYAVARQLQQAVARETGADIGIDDLLQQRYASITGDIVISCATDGNHGRSVAWGCKMFGCRCVIYIHRDVSAGRQQAMEAFGAEVIRIDGNYDESVRQADRDAARHGRIIVSDTSYPGYMDIPRDVALGYTVMLAEAVEQMQGSVPTHVFIQGGVGGLAASVCAYFWELWGAARPRFVVVEPERALRNVRRPERQGVVEPLPGADRLPGSQDEILTVLEPDLEQQHDGEVPGVHESEHRHGGLAVRREEDLVGALGMTQVHDERKGRNHQEGQGGE